MRTLLYHVLVWLALSMVSTGAAQADPPAGYPFVDYNAGLARAKAENRPIMLYFGRYGCAWCDHVNRKTFSDPELKALYSDRYVLIYVDSEGSKRLKLPSGERVTEAELGARLGAYATPLFVFMDVEGRVLAKVPGFKTVEDFRAYDRYVSTGEYRTKTLMEYLASTK